MYRFGAGEYASKGLALVVEDVQVDKVEELCRLVVLHAFPLSPACDQDTIDFYTLLDHQR